MFNLEQIAAYGYALLDDAVVDAETFLSALYLLSLNLPMAPSFDTVGKVRDYYELEGGADYAKCFETLRNAWYRENPDKGLDLAGADTETRRTIIGILDHIPNTESLMEAASNTSWGILAFLAPLLQPGRLDYAWQKDNLSSQIIKNTWNAWTDAIFDWKELFTTGYLKMVIDENDICLVNAKQLLICFYEIVTGYRLKSVTRKYEQVRDLIEGHLAKEPLPVKETATRAFHYLRNAFAKNGDYLIPDLPKNICPNAFSSVVRQWEETGSPLEATRFEDKMRPFLIPALDPGAASFQWLKDGITQEWVEHVISKYGKPEPLLFEVDKENPNAVRIGLAQASRSHLVLVLECLSEFGQIVVEKGPVEDWLKPVTTIQKESDRSALLFAKDKNAIKSALETLKEDERWNERLRKQW